jgi:hypothetical protein
LLGAPATAAPVTPLSVAAKPMVQESDVVQARWWHWGWGRWHGGWHGGRYRCAPFCRWGG